jgi:hypothetical protein
MIQFLFFFQQDATVLDNLLFFDCSTCFERYFRSSLGAYGKPETATAVVAPDNGHEDARNMLSCI